MDMCFTLCILSTLDVTHGRFGGRKIVEKRKIVQLNLKFCENSSVLSEQVCP